MFFFVAAAIVIWPSSQVTEAKANHGSSNTYSAPLQGYHADRMCSFLNYNGTFTLQHFDVQSGQLVAEGFTSGTITNTCGQTIATISNQPQTLPISSISSTCDTLSLTTAQTTLQSYQAQIIILPSQNLDITPNLYGNRLCHADNATKHGSADKQADKLNKLLGL